MNVLLLEGHEVDAEGLATVTGRRAEHVARVLGKVAGDSVGVGRLGGELGFAEIVEVSRASLRLRCVFDRPAPPKRAVTLVLALPRPPVLKRTLQHATAMGVDGIVLLHTRRVEKSYWQSPALEPAALQDQLRLGLEQAVDTCVPTLEVARGFRPFVEDRLPKLIAGSRLLVSDPRATERCPTDVEGHVTLAIGPEGGFIPWELEQLEAAGATLVGLGTRILRVETAVAVALGRLGLG